MTSDDDTAAPDSDEPAPIDKGEGDEGAPEPPHAPASQSDLISLATPSEAAGDRLDKLLAERSGAPLSRSRWKALIEGGAVQINGGPTDDPSYKVREGDLIEARTPPPTAAAPKPQKIPLDILYEDKDVIVINKPAGMVVHPAAGNWSGTLVNALLAHCPEDLSGVGGVMRPGVVHRLDKDTSGVLVVAKNDAAHQGLTRQFAAHDVERLYVAVAHGAPRPGIGVIDAPLARIGNDRKKMSVVKDAPAGVARRAVTHYKVLTLYGRNRAALPGDASACLLECRLETGRTHQIRAHFAHIGHPLIGDPLYGRRPGLAGLKLADEAATRADDAVRRFRRQALHARILGFTHPISGEFLRFESEPPKDMQRLISALETL